MSECPVNGFLSCWLGSFLSLKHESLGQGRGLLRVEGRDGA